MLRCVVLHIEMDGSFIVLMIDAVSTSETSVNFYETTRPNIPEDSHLQFTVEFRRALYTVFMYYIYMLRKLNYSSCIQVKNILWNPKICLSIL
jgi:hypothetical protein